MRKKRPTYAELRREGYERGYSDGEHDMYQKAQDGWEPSFLWVVNHSVRQSLTVVQREMLTPGPDPTAKLAGWGYRIDGQKSITSR